MCLELMTAVWQPSHINIDRYYLLSSQSKISYDCPGQMRLRKNVEELACSVPLMFNSLMQFASKGFPFVLPTIL